MFDLLYHADVTKIIDCFFNGCNFIVMKFVFFKLTATFLVFCCENVHFVLFLYITINFSDVVYTF